MPDYAVFCPGNEPGGYCDCSGDCTATEHSFCECEEAAACCTAAYASPDPSPSPDPSTCSVSTDCASDKYCCCDNDDPADYTCDPCDECCRDDNDVSGSCPDHCNCSPPPPPSPPQPPSSPPQPPSSPPPPPPPPPPPSPPTPPWLPDRVGERVVSTDAELQRAVSDPATSLVTFAAERIVLSRTLELDHDITLVGPAVLDAAAQGFRVVHVQSGVSAALVDLTLTGGSSNYGSYFSYSYYYYSEGCYSCQLDVSGGGVLNEGNLNISGATIANNSAYVRRALDLPPPRESHCAGRTRASRACAAVWRRSGQLWRYDDQRHHRRQQFGFGAPRPRPTAPTRVVLRGSDTSVAGLRGSMTAA
jgi:hypothetical protein